MIEKPVFISRSGTVCPINLGVGVSAFDGDSKIGMHVNWEGVVCVKWSNNGAEYEYSAPGEKDTISAYPTPDMEKMVVVKLGENSGAPNNAVVLSDEAEVIVPLLLPQRISKEKWLPRGGLYCFMQSGWCEYEDHIFFYLSIADTDWVETRYFNYKTMTWDNERYETWRL